MLTAATAGFALATPPKQAAQARPDFVPPLKSNGKITIFSSTDLNLYCEYDDKAFFLNDYRTFLENNSDEQKTFAAMQAYAVKEAASKREGFRPSPESVKVDIKRGGDWGNKGPHTVFHNHPKTSGLTADRLSDMIGPETIALIIAGSPIKNDPNKNTFKNQAIALGNAFAQQGADTIVLDQPNPQQIEKYLTAMEKELTTSHKNFIVVLRGHGRADPDESIHTGSRAHHYAGSILIKAHGGENGDNFFLEENQFVARMNAIQKRTGKHGYLAVCACQDGSWTAKQPILPPFSF